MHTTSTVPASAEGVGISKLDLAAIRQADRISFHFHEGVHSVVCTKKVESPGPYGDSERDYEFPVKGGFPYSKTARACFAMIYTTRFNEEWQTIAGCLKVGDELRLHWRADSNQYLRDAGLHFDELLLHVKRGSKVLVFSVATSICPDNTARMIRGLVEA